MTIIGKSEFVILGKSEIGQLPSSTFSTRSIILTHLPMIFEV